MAAIIWQWQWSTKTQIRNSNTTSGQDMDIDMNMDPSQLVHYWVRHAKFTWSSLHIQHIFVCIYIIHVHICLHKKYIDQKGDNFFVSPHFQPPLLFWRSCNGERHATKRFRNETNAIYYSFSFQPAVNWSTIGHLWLFCASGGGTFVLPVVAHLLTPNLPKRTKHKTQRWVVWWKNLTFIHCRSCFLPFCSSVLLRVFPKVV